jgi:hypothetical protein
MLGVSSLNAEVIYGNTSNDLSTRFEPGVFEVGDQIVLTSMGWLMNFSFEYWGTTTNPSGNFTGNVEARVRFYRMDGEPIQGYASPGTSFYDSGWFSVAPTERATMQFLAGQDFSPNGHFIPVTDMTWSVQFRNMGTGDSVGLDIFSPPEIGGNYPDYWQRDEVWALRESNLEPQVPMNFAARFEATIPEPSTMSLMLFGGLAAYLLRKRQG